MKPNQNADPFRESIRELLGRDVVLDTPGTVVYLGRLRDADATGFWLESADVHDCSEGHAGKEVYVLESAHYGIRMNRKRVFVLRASVISLSALEDVVTEISSDREYWTPSDKGPPTADDDFSPLPLD